MFEYEDTLQLVAEVEGIVRSIEDEKIQEEERDKTRDIFARIKGLDKVKQLAAPKPSRVLLEERMLNPRESSDAGNAKAVGMKGPFKLSSNVLLSGMGIGSLKDVWLIVFDDVVLRCQRIGMTSLPVGAAHSSRANSLSGLQGSPRYATVATSRRNASARPRNLYKFIKVSANSYQLSIQSDVLLLD
jgi:hypothetical protein